MSGFSLGPFQRPVGWEMLTQSKEEPKNRGGPYLGSSIGRTAWLLARRGIESGAREQRRPHRGRGRGAVAAREGGEGAEAEAERDRGRAPCGLAWLASVVAVESLVLTAFVSRRLSRPAVQGAEAERTTFDVTRKKLDHHLDGSGGNKAGGQRKKNNKGGSSRAREQGRKPVCLSVCLTARTPPTAMAR
ncbi:hypothetical protein CDD83_1729 [Cordyceps sp. RAO-2017]|nr:hypothetical protein CDD83_1729 [Cordyceps sp. RAO-2017]